MVRSTKGLPNSVVTAAKVQRNKSGNPNFVKGHKLNTPNVDPGAEWNNRKPSSTLHTPEEFEALKKQVPTDVFRVRVYTPSLGRMRYIPPNMVDPTIDIYQVNKFGVPVCTWAPAGKPRTEGVPRYSTDARAQALQMDAVSRVAVAVEEDPVLKAARETPEDAAVLQQVLLALGEEAASIKHERQKAERNGERTSEYSTRRIAALKAVADTWLKRKDQLVSRGIDMASPAFRVYLKFLMETVQEAMLGSGVRPEMVETVFARLAKSMDGDWETEARNRIKSVV